MPSSLHIILTELPKLRPSEIFYVSKAVEDQAMSIATVTTASYEIKEKRFNKGVICPHWNTNHTVRNDKVNSKQRYLCKGCGKSFDDFTNSAMSGTKRIPDKWFAYIKCMIKGYALRQTATVVGISLSTAFVGGIRYLMLLERLFNKNNL